MWQSFIPLVVFVLWVILALGFFLPRVLKSIRKDRAEIKNYAEELGLSYSDGWELRKGEYPEIGTERSAAALEKLPKPVRELLEGSSPWRIVGEWKGIRVEIIPAVQYGSDKSKSFIIAKAFYERPLTFKMRAYRESVSAKIGKVLFNMKDVQIGDPEFDPRVRVVSDDAAGAANVFYRKEAVSAFLALLERFPNAAAETEWVVYARPGSKPAADEIPEALDLLTAFAREVKAP